MNKSLCLFAVFVLVLVVPLRGQTGNGSAQEPPKKESKPIDYSDSLFLLLGGQGVEACCRAQEPPLEGPSSDLGRSCSASDTTGFKRSTDSPPISRA